MESTTLIRDLNETQILAAIREMFEGERIAAIDLESLIDRSETLGDLYSAVRITLDETQRK